MLAVVAVASDNPKDYDDRVTSATLEGTWIVKSIADNGQPDTSVEAKKIKLVFKGDRATLHEKSRPETMIYHIDAGRRPAHLDLTMGEGPIKGETMKMVYVLEGDVLMIGFYMGNKGDTRPTELKTGTGSNMRVIVLKRAGN
jgi:uncharacterized protein (TIGR03067 family)